MTDPAPGGRPDEPTPPHGEPASGAVPPWDPAADRTVGGAQSQEAPQDSPWASPSAAPGPGDARADPPSGYGQAGYGQAGSTQPGYGPPPGPPPGYGPAGYGAPPGPQAGYGQPGYGQPAGGPGMPFGGPPRAPKPGVVPLRPLGVGEVLDGAVSYIRAHPKVVLGASAIVAVISQLVQVPLQLLLFGNVADLGNSPDLAGLTGLFAGAAAGGFLGGLITLVATSVLTGVLMVVISRSVLGAPVDAGETWRAARPRVPGLLGVVLLVTLIGVLIVAVGVAPGLLLLLVSDVAGIIVIVLGVLAAIVALVWVSVSLSLAAPAYVLEGVGVTAALRRSWALVKGRFWPVLGIQLLASVIAAVLASIISVPFSIVASVVGAASATGATSSVSAMAVPTVLISAVGAIIALTLTAPFQSGVVGLLYVDQRMRSEGFDIELQRATAAGPRS